MTESVTGDGRTIGGACVFVKADIAHRLIRLRENLNVCSPSGVSH